MNRLPFTENIDININLIFGSSFKDLANNSAQLPSIRMSNRAILSENTSTQFQNLPSSRNKERAAKGLKTSSNFLAPVLAPNSSEHEMVKTGYSGHSTIKQLEK